MKGLTLEMNFEYPGVDGAKYMDWYQGKIINVTNETKFSVKIEWDERTLAESDVQFSVHKLMPGNWNPKKIRKGVWREYIAQKEYKLYIIWYTYMLCILGIVSIALILTEYYQTKTPV